MTVSHTPSPARSDLTAGTRPAAATTTRPFLRHGRLLSVGAVAWATGIPLFGDNQTPPSRCSPSASARARSRSDCSPCSGCCGAPRPSARPDRPRRAAGRGRHGRLPGDRGRRSSTPCSVSDLDQAGWLLLDAFWPLSMMGMFFIGIRIADRRPLEGREPVLADGRRELGRRGDPDDGHLRPVRGRWVSFAAPARRLRRPRRDRLPQAGLSTTTRTRRAPARTPSSRADRPGTYSTPGGVRVGGVGTVDIRPFSEDHRRRPVQIARLSTTVQWPSLTDPDVVRRVCTAPGASAYVAVPRATWWAGPRRSATGCSSPT